MTGKEVLTSDVVKQFLDCFGITVDPFEDPEGFIETLKQVDPRYQGEHRLRFQLESDQTNWPEEVKVSVMACAKYMRMLDEGTYLSGDFNAVVVLGGARQSNLDRTLYAIEALDSEEASFSQLIVAGSNRKLSDPEKENVANYAPGAETEFDLCSAAAKIAAIQNPGMITCQMMVANEKAGTPEVLAEVLYTLRATGLLSMEDSVAAITTQIYQLSTELDLARVANEFGNVSSMVAGTPSDPNVVSKRTTATYLSEVLRTLRAATLAAQAGV